MMKKCMLLSIIAVLCAAGSVYALPDSVAHWPLEGSAEDISGNGYTATFGGGETQGIEGVYGNAVQFHYGNTDSWMDVPIEVWNDHVEDTQQFTICFWYKIDTIANNVAFASSSGGGRELQCHLPWPSNGNVYFDSGGRDTGSFAGNGGLTGVWQHWVFQRDPATGHKQVWLDGAPIITDTRTAALGVKANFVFGSNQAHTTNSGAAFDDIRVYDVVLTEAEILEVIDGVGLQSLGAHTPVPKGTVLSNDVPATTSVSWYSPLQDGDGIAIPDSNIVSVDNYKVWWGIGEEPNFLSDTPDDNGTSQSYTPTTPIDYNEVYYWRVDTTITLDANDITGEFNSVIEGSVWNFVTEPSYTPIAIDTFDNAITTLDLGSAPLAATVTGNSEPIYSVDFEILTDAADYPAGSDAVLSDDGPTALTTTLTTSVAGNYKVKITVTDYDDANTGPETTVTDIAEVVVYADACQAAKDSPSGWDPNYYDRNDDCSVNLGDWDELAVEWLTDTSMQVQETYTGLASYATEAIYANRIETEWAALGPNSPRPVCALDTDPNMYGDDPNSCSDHPMTDESGAPRLRLVDGTGYDDDVSRCRFSHGRSGNALWADYKIDVPALAVGVPIDVYCNYAVNADRVIRFSSTPVPIAVVDDTTLDGITAGATIYAEINLPSTGSYNNYYPDSFGTKIGQVTFTASGEQRVRMSFDDSVNFDWISFDW